MTGILPAFDADGLLPPGDYLLTLGQLKQSQLVLGPGRPQGLPNLGCCVA